MAASSVSSIAPASSAGGSSAALSAQEALARLRSAQEAAAVALSAQEAVAQLASLQEASAQLAADQDADAHETSAQDASAHEASLLALAAQLAASKTRTPLIGSVTMKAFSAKFGFGGLTTASERPALTSPTPSERSVAVGIGFVPSMRAPLTWSEVYSGCLPRINAETPLTIGAAKEVPESSM